MNGEWLVFELLCEGCMFEVAFLESDGHIHR